MKCGWCEISKLHGDDDHDDVELRGGEILDEGTMVRDWGLGLNEGSVMWRGKIYP